MPYRPNDHNSRHLINVVEDTVLANTQLPDGRDMLPGRYQPNEHLLVSGLPCWLVLQFSFDSIKDPCADIGAQIGQVVCHAFREFNAVHV